MTYCSRCGAAQREGARYCAECGAPIANAPAPTIESTPQTEYIPQKQQKHRRRKPLLRRWWVWVLIIVVIVGALGKRAGSRPSRTTPRQAETIATARPAASAKPASTPRPKATAAPTPPAAPPGVSPEFKETMDSCEAFIDEFIAFLKAMDDDPDDFILLLKYASMMLRYTETLEKLDAIDESKLSPADDAYYVEVMARIDVKLLEAMQYME